MGGSRGLCVRRSDPLLSFSGKHQAAAHVESHQPQGDQGVLMVLGYVTRKASTDAAERCQFGWAQYGQ
jgi:hypothetical protein